MGPIFQSFNVSFAYPVYFTERLFDRNNPVLHKVLKTNNGSLKKIIVVIDHGVFQKHPTLTEDIRNYFKEAENLLLVDEFLIIPGGEPVKNSTDILEKVLSVIHSHSLDRHSYLAAIGGGAVLDMAGFAAAVAHRGIRHIRIPTTVLSQNDSGVGVKNGINAFDKKNFLGTFSPPFAVINDFHFLNTLEERDWRSGITEAIKVALIKDSAFFQFIKNNVAQLLDRDMGAMKKLIYQSAKMHLDHIAQGDPFEKGSSRPLDFGHWAAHKLEQLSAYSIRHGEAVAIGISLDATYAYLSGLLPEDDWKEILGLINTFGFKLYTPELSFHLDKPQHTASILMGLTEFREHLGGVLTIMLLDRIGHGIEVHEMDEQLIKEAIQLLKNYQNSNYSKKIREI